MARNHPNVLLIIADDMGYADMGRFSEGRVRTPNLDALAEEGLCLTQHYSGSPVCSPARASLLTGRYSHRSGALTVHDLFGLDRIALREATLADMFKSAGYQTGLVGKWHNGSLDRRFEPNARGFDEFAGFLGGWSDYYDWHLQRDSSISKGDGRYLTHVLTDEACGFIDRHADDPFFLMLAYSAPHSPFQAPDALIERYRAQGYDRVTATTYAMIEVMDQGIGTLMTKLDDHGLADDTIVLFTSDNGPAFFNPPFMLDPDEPSYTERFNAGMRGSKGWVYEGGIKVPLILRSPNRLPANQTCHDLVHFVDWMPTLAALCDIDTPTANPLDGRDVSPQLRGEAPIKPAPRFWQWNFFYPHLASNAAMRDGQWKLIRPMIPGTRYYRNPDLFADEYADARAQAFIDGDIQERKQPGSIKQLLPVPSIKLPPSDTVELYNLEDDPGEANDLAGHHPDRVAAMMRELETWFESVEHDRHTIDDRLHRLDAQFAS